MRPSAPPPPKYAFGYRTPPTSGNAINGLGERAGNALAASARGSLHMSRILVACTVAVYAGMFVLAWFGQSLLPGSH